MFAGSVSIHYIHDDNDSSRSTMSIYSLNLQYSAWPTRELDQLSVRLSHLDWGIYWGAETEVTQLQTKWLVLVERIEEEGGGRRWEASALAAGETQTDQVPAKGTLS